MGEQEKVQKNATLINDEKNKQIDELKLNLEQVLKENKKLRQKITDGNIDMEIRVARLGKRLCTTEILLDIQNWLSTAINTREKIKTFMYYSL